MVIGTTKSRGTAANLVSSDGTASFPPGFLFRQGCAVSQPRVRPWDSRIYKEGHLGPQKIPHLTALTSPTTPPNLLYSISCGRRLHALRETGPLRRSRHQRHLFPRYDKPARDTPYPLSHLLHILSPLFSATNHSQLIPLPLCSVAAFRNLWYSSTRSPCGIVQRSSPAVVLRCHRGPFPTGGHSSPEA